MVEYFLPLELKEGTSFICPVCGSYLAGINKPEICEHVLFIHDRDSNDFIYCNEDCIEIVQESMDSENNSDNEILETLIGRLKATTTIFFELTLSDPDIVASNQVMTIGIDLSV
jgi:hypothetical protein